MLVASSDEFQLVRWYASNIQGGFLRGRSITRGRAGLDQRRRSRENEKRLSASSFLAFSRRDPFLVRRSQSGEHSNAPSKLSKEIWSPVKAMGMLLVRV